MNRLFLCVLLGLLCLGDVQSHCHNCNWFERKWCLKVVDALCWSSCFEMNQIYYANVSGTAQNISECEILKLHYCLNRNVTIINSSGNTSSTQSMTTGTSSGNNTSTNGTTQSPITTT